MSEQSMKTKARLFARLSFILAMLLGCFYLLMPFAVIFLFDSATIEKCVPVLAASVWTTSLLAMFAGIVALWKGNREKLSGNERKMAKGGLFISGAFLLLAIISILAAT